MQYPLSEEIGAPELFVGRKKEMAMFDEWVNRIPARIGKSKAIFSRKKGGKTTLTQRLFNRLWSENGKVIPIFFSIADTEIWLQDFAIDYYRIFASQYISFLERNETFVNYPLSLDEILKYGKANSIEPFIRDIRSFEYDRKYQQIDSIWKTACTAPKRFASYYDIRFLVIIDEFQFLSKYITTDQQKTIPYKTMPGSYHSLSETKIAPMLITGSYTNCLNTVVQKHLEGGRVTKHFFSPYLEPDEGLEAVKVYAKVFNKQTTEESEKQINKLCCSDPFFISCVIQSKFENNDLTTKQGVIDTVHYEITNRLSDMSITWREYIDKTLDDINNIHAKRMLLHMSRDPKQVWIPKELKEELGLEISEKEILERLRKLEKADLIQEGIADIEFQGLNDGTLHLILRSRYGREIDDFDPDIRNDFRQDLEELEQQIKKLEKDKKSISGKYSALKGEVAEYQLAKKFKNSKKFSLSKFFNNVKDKTKLNIIDVQSRLIIQRGDGKNMEIDIKAESDCGRVVLVEVKKWKKKISVNVVKDFIEKIKIFEKQNSDKKILPAVWSEMGFSKQALLLCKDYNIGMN